MIAMSLSSVNEHSAGKSQQSLRSSTGSTYVIKIVAWKISSCPQQSPTFVILLVGLAPRFDLLTGVRTLWNLLRTGCRWKTAVIALNLLGVTYEFHKFSESQKTPIAADAATIYWIIS
jgi:hypothetical protein